MEDPEVVVAGAGIAGLGAAIGLARRGLQVTVIDKDPPPTGIGSEDSFEHWARHSVPQAKQPHLFQARATSKLRDLAPDVFDALLASETQLSGLMLDLLPAEARVPGDDALRSLLSRRLPFELALRRAVEAEPLVEVLAPAALAAVHLDADGITGVSLADGPTLHAPWLIDAAGRRSPVRGMLEGSGAVLPPERSQACALTYFTRHFRRLNPGPPLWSVMAVRADFGHLLVLGFPGDRETFSIGLVAATSALPELGALRHPDVWNRVAAALPRVAPWVDEAAAEPLTDVLVMAGQRNVLRDFCADGQPVVPGWLPLGDALCTTNPVLALGASLAMTHASAAVDAVTSGQPRVVAGSAYHGGVFGEATLWFESSAAGDRIRGALVRGEDLDAADSVLDQQERLFRQGVAAGARAGDADLLRAMMRRLHVVDGPDDWLDDDDLVSRAQGALDVELSADVPLPGPTRDELLALVAP